MPESKTASLGDLYQDAITDTTFLAIGIAFCTGLVFTVKGVQYGNMSYIIFYMVVLAIATHAMKDWWLERR